MNKSADCTGRGHSFALLNLLQYISHHITIIINFRLYIIDYTQTMCNSHYSSSFVVSSRLHLHLGLCFNFLKPTRNNPSHQNENEKTRRRQTVGTLQKKLVLAAAAAAALLLPFSCSSSNLHKIQSARGQLIQTGTRSTQNSSKIQILNKMSDNLQTPVTFCHIAWYWYIA